MKLLLGRLLRGDSGQDLIEYTLLLAFVALASAGLFISSGGDVSKIWSSANSMLSKATGSPSPSSGGGNSGGGDGGGDGGGRH